MISKLFETFPGLKEAANQSLAEETLESFPSLFVSFLLDKDAREEDR